MLPTSPLKTLHQLQLRLSTTAVTLLLINSVSEGQDVTTELIFVTPSNDIAVNGVYTSINGSGDPVYSTTAENGRLQLLKSGYWMRSPFLSDTCCIEVQFQSNDSIVDAFVTTQSNFNAMLASTGGGNLDFRLAKPLPVGRWKQSNFGRSVLALNLTETYVFLLQNNGSFSSVAEVGYRLAVFDKSAANASSQASTHDPAYDVCQSADSGGFATTSRTAWNNSSLAPFLEKNISLSPWTNTVVVAFRNASCASFQIGAQNNATLSQLEMLHLVMPSVAAREWSFRGYRLPFPYVGATCLQTLKPSSNPLEFVASSASLKAPQNASVPANQSCQVSIDNLDPNVDYVLVSTNHVRAYSSRAIIRFTGRYSGSCSTVKFPAATGELNALPKGMASSPAIPGGLTMLARAPTNLSVLPKNAALPRSPASNLAPSLAPSALSQVWSKGATAPALAPDGSGSLGIVPTIFPALSILAPLPHPQAPLSAIRLPPPLAPTPGPQYMVSAPVKYFSQGSGLPKEAVFGVIGGVLGLIILATVLPRNCRKQPTLPNKMNVGGLSQRGADESGTRGTAFPCPLNFQGPIAHGEEEANGAEHRIDRSPGSLASRPSAPPYSQMYQEFLEYQEYQEYHRYQEQMRAKSPAGMPVGGNNPAGTGEIELLAAAINRTL